MVDKQTMVDLLWSDPSKAALAGALGGIVRWVTLRSNWKEGMGTLFVGGICAIYAGPLVLPIIEVSIGKIVPNGDMAGLSSFLVGIGGISLSGLLVDIFDRRRKAAKGDADGNS